MDDGLDEEALQFYNLKTHQKRVNFQCCSVTCLTHLGITKDWYFISIFITLSAIFYKETQQLFVKFFVA
jgi:hypothetical protein